MRKNYDAIIIGAGIIGACISLELSRKGYKTLVLDKLGAAGHGSTAGSCAVIRFKYSTLEGVAMAREAYYHWLDWPKYLGAVDPSGLIKYINTGCMVVKSEKNKYLKNVKASLDALHVGYRELDAAEMKEMVPFINTRQFYPPKSPDDPEFGRPTGGEVIGAVYIPESGLITDPQQSVHNVQHAAECKGAEYIFGARVVEIKQADGKVSGVVLEDGREFEAVIVVNAAGPHSYQINDMAGVSDDMNIHTRPLRHEVCHVPAPDGCDFTYDGMSVIISDADIAAYCRPETGGNLLIGSQDPTCDGHDWIDDPDNYNSPMRRASEMKQVSSLAQLGLRGQGSAGHKEVAAAREYGRAVLISAEEIHDVGMEAALEKIPQAANYFLTIDADGLDPAIAPGVAYPTFGGLTYYHTLKLMRGLAARGNLVGMDFVELVPQADQGGMTALLGARLMLNFIGVICHSSQAERLG